MEEKKAAVIQSLKTGLGLIELIAKERRPMKFTEIQLMSDMAKSNVHKYLTTFVQTGFLERDSSTHTYKLGSKLIEIGTMAQEATSLTELIDPYMKAFTNETGLTALIALPSLNGPYIKEIWSVTYGINIGAQNGMVLPLLSSTGYIFYAFQEGLQLSKWIIQSSRELSIETKQTIRKEIEQIEKTSFIAKKEPLIEHISSCSVPVFNTRQELTAAITVVGYHNLVPNDPQHSVAEKMLELAQQLSHFFK